jgi:hypothetical protein
MTCPRASTTPSTAGIAFGTGVMCSIISICCTKRLRTP